MQVGDSVQPEGRSVWRAKQQYVQQYGLGSAPAAAAAAAAKPPAAAQAQPASSAEAAQKAEHSKQEPQPGAAALPNGHAPAAAQVRLQVRFWKFPVNVSDGQRAACMLDAAAQLACHLAACESSVRHMLDGTGC